MSEFNLLQESATIQQSRVVYNNTNEYLLSNAAGPVLPTTGLVEGMLFYKTDSRELYLRTQSNSWSLVYSSALLDPISISNLLGSSNTAGFVKYANLSEVLSGSITNKVVSPKNLAGLTATTSRAGLVKLASAGVARPYDMKEYFDAAIPDRELSHRYTGYQDLDGGVTMCWGSYRARYAGGATYGVVFPKGFSSAPYTIMITQRGPDYDSRAIETGVIVTEKGNRHFKAKMAHVGDTGGTGPTHLFHDWIAFGPTAPDSIPFVPGAINTHHSSHSATMSLYWRYYVVDRYNGKRILLVSTATTSSYQLLVKQDTSSTWQPTSSMPMYNTTGFLTSGAFAKDIPDLWFGNDLKAQFVRRGSVTNSILNESSSKYSPTLDFDIANQHTLPGTSIGSITKLDLSYDGRRLFCINSNCQIGVYWRDLSTVGNPHTQILIRSSSELLPFSDAESYVQNSLIIGGNVLTGYSALYQVLWYDTEFYDENYAVFFLSSYDTNGNAVFEASTTATHALYAGRPAVAAFALSGDAKLYANVLTPYEPVGGKFQIEIRGRSSESQSLLTRTPNVVEITADSGFSRPGICFMGQYLLVCSLSLSNGVATNSKIHCTIKSYLHNGASLSTSPTSVYSIAPEMGKTIDLTRLGISRFVAGVGVDKETTFAVVTFGDATTGGDHTTIFQHNP